MVKSLKSTLARARESVSRSKEPTASSSKEHVAVLTKTNAKGGQHPLPAPRYGEESLKGSKGKGKRTKVETHQSGERVRYFADDDKYSLSQMVSLLVIVNKINVTTSSLSLCEVSTRET